MNPLKQFRAYFIGQALAQTDDVFEKAKIEVLFNFTIFFIFLNIPYTLQSIDASFFIVFLNFFGIVALASILLILRKTGDVKWAIYFYIFNHTLQNGSHFFVNNGILNEVGITFFLLGILFPFLMLGRGWGFVFTVYELSLIFVGIYNQNSGYQLFHFSSIYADPPLPPELRFLIVIPLLLNIYLVSEFVKARGKAELQIKDQKVKLELTNKELEVQKVDIISSINYARKIQYAVLPAEDSITRSIPLSFILFKPRDIVSGDFFWFHEIDEKSYILVSADCTGHGVPGAFMTVIGSSLLNQIVIENRITEPSKILTELDKRISITLKQEKERLENVRDGMDLSLIKVDKQKKEFTFTSAKRPAIFIRNKEIQEIKGSKFTLGGMRMGEKTFEEIKINYREDDIIYFFTDGFTDQFGGEKGKKFGIKQLRELLINVHQLPMNEQKQKLETAIDNWKGGLEQVDDIQLIGIRF